MPHDIRYAVRRLRNTPGFSAVAIVTIALAIGVNAAVFSFVYGIFLRPLPYPEPHRIVRLLERVPAGGLNGISTLNYLDWASQNDVFAYMSAEAGWRPTLTGGDEPVMIRGARVSAHYFDVFGVRPPLGRTFRDGEDQPGQDHVVLISHRLWELRFGSDPAIVGRRLLLDGEAHTVIGVLPKGGPFDRAAAQIWKPLAFTPANMTRDYRWLGATARLKPGVTLQRARDEMDVIAARLGTTFPASNKGWGVAVDRLSDVVIGPGLRTAVTVLFAATLFVLLIGCANLANLGLARSISLDAETAVRAALGASRWRLVRQSLIEHLVLSLCGGLVGAGAGHLMLKWIQSLIPPAALPPAVDVRMNGSVLAFTLVAALGAGVVFGLAPAVQAARLRLTAALGKGGHGTTRGTPGRRVRGALVVAEVALAFILMVEAGLLMRTFFKLLDVDPGFDATNVLTAGLPIDQQQHPDPAELNAYLASIGTAVETVPGVRRVAFTSALPLMGWGFGVPYSIPGRDTVDPTRRAPVFFKIVSPSYFDALGIKLVAGRLLDDRDGAGAPRVAVINETLARREFSGRRPVGGRIVVPEIVAGKTGFGRQISWEIVGVIAAEKINGLGDDASAGMYVSYQQSPTYGVELVVQGGVPPLSLQKGIRAAIDRVNSNQALSDVRTLEDVLRDSMRGNRVMSMLLIVFSAMALSLAAVGIYGVIAYTAARRTHEMGIRAALGATRGRLCRSIVGDGMRPAIGGLAAGIVGALPATDVLSSMLFGVATYDVVTIAAVAAALSGVAGVACFLPAWRITKSDPMTALRDR